MTITSVNNPLIKETCKLHQKKYRDNRQVFLVEGFHLYEEAQKANIIRQVFTTDSSIVGQNVVHVSEHVLLKLSQTKQPQGIVTVCNKPNNIALTDRILILEKVQDPGNVGTLLRSALAFGFQTILLDQTVDIYNDKVIRSTQGALFTLNFVQMDTKQFIQEHPEYTVFGTSLNGRPLHQVEFPEKLAIIVGNEGSGVDKATLEMTHDNITIQTSNVESLNVGVAGSIIMHLSSLQQKI